MKLNFLNYFNNFFKNTTEFTTSVDDRFKRVTPERFALLDAKGTNVAPYFNDATEAIAYARSVVAGGGNSATLQPNFKMQERATP